MIDFLQILKQIFWDRLGVQTCVCTYVYLEIPVYLEQLQV